MFLNAGTSSKPATTSRLTVPSMSKYTAAQNPESPIKLFTSRVGRSQSSIKHLPYSNRRGQLYKKDVKKHIKEEIQDLNCQELVGNPIDLLETFRGHAHGQRTSTKKSCDCYFKEYQMQGGEYACIQDVDMKVLTTVPSQTRMRMSPIEDVEKFAKQLTAKPESLAGPVIEIEDFDDFYSNCQEFQICHNIWDWKKYKNLKLRVYKNLQSLEFEELDAEVFEDYVKVCGPMTHPQDSGHSGDSSIPVQQQQHRHQQRQELGCDDGYEGGDTSPKPTSRTLAIVADPADTCGVGLFFSREVGDQCSTEEPHSITVHVVLDKPGKIDEFRKTEMPMLRL